VNEPTADIGVHPSTGQPAELTLVENGVIHFRAFADGTGISRGPCAVPSPSRPCPRTESAMPPAGSSRGSAATASSLRSWRRRKGRGLSTINGKGTNADGSTFSFHQTGHTVFDADGVPKLDFFKVHAHCP
jgi:hypothetical protein